MLNHTTKIKFAVLAICSLSSVSYAGFFDWFTHGTATKEEKSDTAVIKQRACIDYVDEAVSYGDGVRLTNIKDDILTKREIENFIEKVHKTCKNSLQNFYNFEKETKVFPTKCDFEKYKINDYIGTADKAAIVYFKQNKRTQFIPYERINASYEVEVQNHKIFSTTLTSNHWMIDDENVPSIPDLTETLKSQCLSLGGTIKPDSIRLDHSNSSRWLQAECASAEGFYASPPIPEIDAEIDCEHNLEEKYGARLLSGEYEICHVGKYAPELSKNSKEMIRIDQSYSLAIKNDEKEKLEKFDCLQAERCIKVKDQYGKDEADVIEALYAKCKSKDVAAAVPDKSINNTNGAKPNVDENDNSSITNKANATSK